MSAGSYHTPVLLDEVLSLLLPVPPGTVVDATLGGGGHAEALLKNLPTSTRVVGIDADQDACTAASSRLRPFGDRFTPVKGNFANLIPLLARLNVSSPSGFLFDLGVSSYQIDSPEKGFSFMSDRSLDMRMDASQTLNAEMIISTYSSANLEAIFSRYGEERHARRIARAIERRRSHAPVKTSRDLATLIEDVVGQRNLVKSLARVFQALRIEVNNELECLERALRDAINILRSGGRIVVISYHSLEDRITKSTFKEASALTRPSGTKLVADTPLQPQLTILTKKIITPSPAELRRNPRSRSAKLRAAEKI